MTENKVTRINVRASRQYDILIGRGLLGSAGKLISEIHAPCKALIVSDDTVFGLYGKTVQTSLENSGFSCECFVFPHGEASKNPQNLIQIVSLAAKLHMTRSDIFVALGGGVTGDLCGFAAATYMRGVEFIGIPTTVLAAVDSSVGGKTAVDLPEGKNLMGAFHQPSRVICDTECFKTLDSHTFADGLAEAAKYGVIRSESLFRRFSGDISGETDNIIAECVTIKKDIVEADEFDHGERALLNFGHTVGHAVEKLSEFKITHGHAVAIGMAVIAKCAEAYGLCENGTAKRIVEVLTKLGLPTETELSAREIASAALNDKKASGKTLSLVLPEKIGRAYVHDIPLNELESFLSAK